MSELPQREQLCPDRERGIRAALAAAELSDALFRLPERFRAAQHSVMMAQDELGASGAATLTAIRQGPLRELSRLVLAAEEAIQSAHTVSQTLHAELEALEREQRGILHEVDRSLSQLDWARAELRRLAPHAVLDPWDVPVPHHYPGHPGLDSSDLWCAPPMSGAGVGVHEAYVSAIVQQEWEAYASMHNQASHLIQMQAERWRQCGRERRESESRAAARLGQLRSELESELPRTVRVALRVSGGTGGVAGFAARRGEGAAEVRTFVGVLLDPYASREQVTAAWQGVAEHHPNADAVISEHALSMTGVAGLPPEVQQRAAELAFAYARKDPHGAYVAMGFLGSGLSVTGFVQQVQGLRRALNETAEGRDPHRRPRLIAFGRHRDAVTAQVAFGDPARSPHLVVLVPGMYSSASRSAATIRGAREIYDGLQSTVTPRREGAGSRGRIPPSNTAVVAWLGYDSPGVLGEPSMQHARAGAVQLAQTLEVATAFAPGGGRVLDVGGHSYGSTTGGEALTFTTAPVRTFATFGSAGLRSDLRRSDLAVERIVAFSYDPQPMFPKVLRNSVPAIGVADFVAGLLLFDGIAPIGRTVGSHRVDPRSLVEGTAEPRRGKRAEARRDQQTVFPFTSHAIWTGPEHGRLGYLSAGAPSLVGGLRAFEPPIPSATSSNTSTMEQPHPAPRDRFTVETEEADRVTSRSER